MRKTRFEIDPSLARSPYWMKMMDFYQTLKPGLWLMRLPLLGPYLQKRFIIEGRDANWFVPPMVERARVPVNAAIPRGQQQALPVAVVEHLLREAGGIFAMKACPCRAAFHCKDHPWDLGCLHIGPAAKGIPAEVGHLLTLEEGLAHVRRAAELGLIPTILYIPAEAEIFGVEKTRMLSLCFCCECCCDVRLMLRAGPDRYWDLYNHRLPGLNITVGAECTRCGACVAACYGGERVIRIGDQRAEIGERCIGCGRCAAACPEGAIALAFDPTVDWLEALMGRIREKVEIGPAEPPGVSVSR